MKKILLLSLIFLTLTSCYKTMLTKKEAYPVMYDKKVKSILVLPPINETSSADAAEHYMSTILEPLAMKGYYVFSPEVMTEIFKSEGIYDGSQLKNSDPKIFKTFFGADAVLEIKIKKWETVYLVVGGGVTVGAEFNLISTATSEVLWSYSGEVAVDTSSKSKKKSNSFSSIIDSIVSTAIKTAKTDYIPIARDMNIKILRALPFGQYHESHRKDQEDKVENQKHIEFKWKN